MNYYIPTYKRHKHLLGKDYFISAKYVLPESQKKDYLKVLPEERIITLPDDEDGNLCRKRNWIMKNIKRPFIMLDDDVYCIKAMQNRVNNDKFTKFEKISFDMFDSYMDNIVNLCDEWGIKYFGVMYNTNEMEYKEYLPFSLTNVINGPFQGHLEHDLLYDERMPTKDDYDMTLQQLNKYKKVLRINFLAFHKYSTTIGANEGGLTGIRTQEYEINNCKAIMKKWGEKIIKYNIPPKDKTDLLNGRLDVPIKGV